MNTHSISRRHFAHLLGIGAAAAIVRPRITIAADQPPRTSTSTGIVRLSANENPYGPSAKAHEAMKNAHPMSNRYPDEANDVLIDIVQAGVRRGQRHHVNAVEHLETVHPLDRFRLRDAITAAQTRHSINL